MQCARGHINSSFNFVSDDTDCLVALMAMSRTRLVRLGAVAVTMVMMVLGGNDYSTKSACCMH